MSDRRLQVFFAVARQGSFTRAAESLFMTQPAVTFQIKQLEEEFNCRLFERLHQRISLTPAGEVVYDYATRILALSDEMEGRVAELTGQMGGTLAIGASTTLGENVLPAILGDFNAQHPQVHLQLVIANSETTAQRIVEGTLDAAFVDGPVPEKLLLAEPVGETTYKVVFDPSHPFKDLAAVPVSELVEYEYVSREKGAGTRAVIDAYFKSVGVAPDKLKVVMELGSPGALKGVVRNGLGFAIMSSLTVADELARGELLARPLDPPLRQPLSMIMPKERFRSKTISAFADFVKRRLWAVAD
jgi:DNA-binding transcriptional LysR family regulator